MRGGFAAHRSSWHDGCSCAAALVMPGQPEPDPHMVFLLMLFPAALLSNMSQLEVCARCKRRLQGALPRSNREVRAALLDVAFQPCLNGTRPGQCQELTPTGLQQI